MAPQSILIIGCGVAGPTLASFLLISDLPAEDKPKITILERATSSRGKGQNVDIRGVGADVMRKLGLEKVIRGSVTGEEGVQFVDSQNGIWAAFGADKSGKIQTGTSDLEILRGRLADICTQRSRSISDEIKKQGGAGIDYVFGDYVDEIVQDGDKVNVHFAKSGQRQSFDLVVGADGLQSLTRNIVWGKDSEAERIKKLGMYAGFFSMPASSTDSEWRRWYQIPGRKGIMIRPSGDKDKVTVLATVIPKDDARFDEVAVDGRKGVSAQKALLKEYFQGSGWECERVVKEMEASDDFYYDMVAQVRMEHFSKGRVVLLGDAGYCASPISGMGTTLGLTGGYNLAGALFRYPQDHTAAFALYEMKMRPIIEKAQKLAPGAPHSMYPETAWGIWFMRSIIYLIWRSGVGTLIFKYVGPPANEVKIADEYGFRQLPEWNGE